ncbi:MAG: hypothetical protein WCA44_13730, partial [Acidobacteriaceae bacterium]
MKPIKLVSIGALALFFGVLAPTYAQQDQGAKPEQHEHQAKPAKQQKQQRQAKPQQSHQNAQRQQPQQHQSRTQQSRQNGPQHSQQQARGQQHGQPQGQWARNGQRDNRGHEYNASRFGPDHHARFEDNGGRYYNGRREYSYGGYWFYAGSYP